ncbi:MAG TPA: tail fiber protein [Rhodothermales bacterium]|nr:tail fiber protein [Rhodothermales bacterium]
MSHPPPFRSDRRAFLRRAVTLAPPAGDPAWAAIEARAAAFGIQPGARVDAQGRPLEGDTFADVDTPFLSEIKIFAFYFPPRGWAFCNGQLLPISQNTALFSLLGTTYGGNGTTTFALPNLQGRVPLHFGNGHTLGEAAGVAVHTLTLSEMPAHVHATPVATAATTNPSGALYATSPLGTPAFATSGATGAWPTSSVGGSQPHENMPPYLALNFCIALQGIFPSRN